LTGQAVIKQAREIAKKYVSNVTGITDERTLDTVAIYGDTDSVVGSTLIQTHTDKLKIEDLYKEYEYLDQQYSQCGHEIIDVSNDSLRVLTFNSKTQLPYMGKVKRLIRHKVSKAKYEINVNGKSVIMTEDHGCIVYRNDKLCRISPKEINTNDIMIDTSNELNVSFTNPIVRCIGQFNDEYVYDIEMDSDTEHTFFANDILVHNSCYLSLKLLPIEFSKNGVITPEGYKHAEALEKTLNEEIQIWAKSSLNSKDCRLAFKREAMADVGLFLEKKRYVLHVLDDEGLQVNKWKYTGVDVVRTTMPKNVKPYVKKIIETMLTTKSCAKTNEVLKEAYDVFQALPIEDVSRTSGIRGYEKYANMCHDFKVSKGMPNHVKAAYFHNIILDKLNLSGKHEKIASGDKIKYFYVQQPNKYGINCIGFKYVFPEEFKSIFLPDRELLFEKIVYAAVERFYQCVNWTPRKPSEQVLFELDDLFGE
jgi:DNA polymerase elongation subunit (family B)